MDHAATAKALFKEGRNCAQAVLAAFEDVTGLDMDTALKISAPFGGGIGRMRSVCGAASGMCMALGMIYADTGTGADKRADLYARTRRVMDAFRQQNGSVICGELLGLDADGQPLSFPGEPSAEKKPCGALVSCAAEILAEQLREDGKI